MKRRFHITYTVIINARCSVINSMHGVEAIWPRSSEPCLFLCNLGVKLDNQLSDLAFRYSQKFNLCNNLKIQYLEILCSYPNNNYSISLWETKHNHNINKNKNMNSNHTGAIREAKGHGYACLYTTFIDPTSIANG